MSIQTHVLTESATVYGWENVRSEHSQYCKESAAANAFFDGTDLMLNILEEVSPQGIDYRILPPPKHETPLSAAEIRANAEKDGLTFIHEIVTCLHKSEYSKDWTSEFCREHSIEGYHPYAFFSNGMVVLRLAEYRTQNGSRRIIPLPCNA